MPGSAGAFVRDSGHPKPDVRAITEDARAAMTKFRSKTEAMMNYVE